MSRLIAFMASDPDRVRCVLHPGRKYLVCDAAHSDGWGIGFYQGGEVLLQRRPKRPTGEVDFYAAASDLRTDALIGHVRVATVGGVKNENTHPFRFRSWLFAHHGTIAHFDEHKAKLLESIPDFLRRNIRGQTDSEHLFHLVLAGLHETNRLDDPLLPPKLAAKALADALRTIDRIAGGPSSEMNVALTNGRVLCASRHGKPVYFYRVNGVRDCPVCRPAPEQGRADKRVDHEHLRAIVLATDVPAGIGAPWEEVPDGHILAVSHELNVELTPLAQS